MGLREWSIGGVLLSPFLFYMALAFAITVGLRTLLHLTGWHRWIWHEALFDVSVFVCVLALVTTVLGPL
jgi:hypothetical protein